MNTVLQLLDLEECNNLDVVFEDLRLSKLERQRRPQA